MGKRAQRKARRETRRRNQYYLWGALALIAVAIVVGIVLANRPEASTTAAGGDYITTDSGLQYRIIEEGAGPTAQPGDTVMVSYIGTLEDGTEFDRGEFPYVIGQPGLIAGFAEGLALVPEGGKAELRIPPELGYGAQGNLPDIQPNETILFEVEILSIEPAS
jgi:FKBP-type peptidyl-prolyl cis-trans isomerase